MPKAAGVPWEVAGALPGAGFTAWAAVRGVGVQPGDTLVSGAAGGVGSLIDTRGGDYVEIALNEFGVQPARVDTIVRFDAVGKYCGQGGGNAAAPAPRRCANWPSSSRRASWRCRSRHLPA